MKKNNDKESGTLRMFMIELHSTTTSNSWVLDTRYGTHISTDIQGLGESRKLKNEEVNLIMGNKCIDSVTRFGHYEIMLTKCVSVRLLYYCYSHGMA